MRESLDRNPLTNWRTGGGSIAWSLAIQSPRSAGAELVRPRMAYHAAIDVRLLHAKALRAKPSTAIEPPIKSQRRTFPRRCIDTRSRKYELIAGFSSFDVAEYKQTGEPRATALSKRTI